MTTRSSSDIEAAEAHKKKRRVTATLWQRTKDESTNGSLVLSFFLIFMCGAS